MNGIDEPGAGEEEPANASRAWVREQLDALRRELETELRTRRVVVVDRDDQVVITLSCDVDVGCIEVRALGDDGGVSVELTADRGPADCAAALSLTRHGDVVAAFIITDSTEGGLCHLVFETLERTEPAFVIDASGTRLE